MIASCTHLENGNKATSDGFHGWRNNQDNQSFVGQFKNEDIIFPQWARKTEIMPEKNGTALKSASDWHDKRYIKCS